jgi:ComF family protein
MKAFLVKSFQSFVGLLFPNTCSACDQVLLESESFICVSCQLALPLFPVSNVLNQRFLLEKVPSVKALYLFQKLGPVQNLIHQIKYRGAKQLATHMGSVMYGAFTPSAGTKLLVPVPLHKARFQERGYNQAEEIANGIAQVSDWALAPNLLHRGLGTQSQTHQGRVYRFQNMEMLFSVSQPDLLQQYETIVLVDDVLTTGATLQACCQELYKAGAQNIEIWVLAATNA